MHGTASAMVAALHMRVPSTPTPLPARLLDRTQWPDTAPTRSRDFECSQAAGEPGVFSEPPRSTPSTPRTTHALRTALIVHRIDCTHRRTHWTRRAAHACGFISHVHS